MHRFKPIVSAIPAMVMLVLSGFAANELQAGSESPLDHRDDYQMDSISGGDFRDYISTHIQENDSWAHSMRAFGSFHNHMHELMTKMARHGAEERGDAEHVPAFSHRISGGQWGQYRQALEEAEDDSAWYELVRITEIMHDRVHHAMARSLIRDRDARGREVDLHDYLRGEALDHGEGIPAEDARRLSNASLDEFREMAWRYDADARYLHESIQSMIVFAHLLDDLLNQWLVYGDSLPAEGCRPEAGVKGQRAAGWQDYLSTIDDCPDAEWREFVKVAGLMRDRIHHMMYKMRVYSQ
ncbi:hypothetical protein J2T60_002584 [Natronospira proteinivora]|uniref:Uncharacterized protein n=1 Tax=Natronospira proteinivora TaxID=1807133 RepID=A0ABT1GB63_9GAMM|nr:hypothetical protein [Natronospira proteinivora]MCP1728570.1 hypothetical protein [Natronospira proteinivora]